VQLPVSKRQRILIKAARQTPAHGRKEVLMADSTPDHGMLVCFDQVGTRNATAMSGLRDVSLDIAGGECVALLGAPGDTSPARALFLLAGLERPAAGDILLEGRSIASMPTERRGFGVVLHEPALLFPHLTASGNIGFPLLMRAVSPGEQARRIARISELLRLDGLGDRRPAELSAEQRLRVALARALVFDPSLVLLDEPFSELTPAQREAAAQELRELQRMLRFTMLLATTDPATALALADRIAVLHAGVVQQEAAPSELYERPANALVAGFFGENNRLRGRVVDAEDGIGRVALNCGPIVEAELADAVPGRGCVLTVRPERIAVALASAEDLGSHALPATLIESSFRGDHLRLRFRIGQGGEKGGQQPGELLVKRPAGAGPAALRPGSGAALAWQPQHARAFLSVA
jgi:putative spermidine/putrescine transport system ATP-binding protein